VKVDDALAVAKDLMQRQLNGGAAPVAADL
jgi:hypothetical protein